MAREFDPFIEAENIESVLSAAAAPRIQSMVAGLGGVEKVFDPKNHNLYIQEHMTAVALLQAAEKIIEPANVVHGTDPKRLISTAFRNGMRLPLFAAKDKLLHSRTFHFMSELGQSYVERPAGLVAASDSEAAEEMTLRLAGLAETGYLALHGAYEPLIDHWEDELAGRSGHGIYVRQGVGFVAALLSEVQAEYLCAIVEDAFPNAV